MKLFVLDEVVDKCLKPLCLRARLTRSKTSPALRQRHVIHTRARSKTSPSLRRRHVIHTRARSKTSRASYTRAHAAKRHRHYGNGTSYTSATNVVSATLILLYGTDIMALTMWQWLLTLWLWTFVAYWLSCVQPSGGLKKCIIYGIDSRGGLILALILNNLSELFHALSAHMCNVQLGGHVVLMQRRSCTEVLIPTMCRNLWVKIRDTVSRGPRNFELSHRIYCFAAEMSQAAEFRLFCRNCPISQNSVQNKCIFGRLVPETQRKVTN